MGWELTLLRVAELLMRQQTVKRMGAKTQHGRK